MDDKQISRRWRFGRAIGLAAAAMLVGGSSVIAQEGRGGFDRLDLDGDGTITRAEIEVAADARFTAADADGDGLLSRTELEAVARNRAAERQGTRIDRVLRRFDANGDGSLSRTELAEGRTGRAFRRADRDGDGRITRDEAADARKDRRELRDERGGRDGDRAESGPRDG